mgnify:CR=1 FL=1
MRSALPLTSVPLQINLVIVPRASSQINALFDSYDADGGGDLDLDELRPTIKRLIEAAKNAKKDLLDLKARTVTLRKMAVTSQRQHAKAKADAAAAIKLQAENETKEAAAKLAAEAEARRQRQEAKEAAAAAKIAEQAEFEAKIAARREENKSQMGSSLFNAGTAWKKGGLAAMMMRKQEGSGNDGSP